MASADILMSLVREHSQGPFGKVLMCAQDVSDELMGKSSPTPAHHLRGGTAWIYGVDVVVTPDSAPCTWRLIRHDHCEVIREYQGAIGRDGGCGALSGALRLECTLDPDHKRRHEAWGIEGNHPVADWPGDDGEDIPARVSHEKCTIIGESPWRSRS
jgi:hypothetical protein